MDQRNPTEEETFAMMRIAELIQANPDESAKTLLCKVYWQGRKDEKENR